MTKIKVEKLVSDNWNIERIKKHNVVLGEVEQAVKNAVTHIHGYMGRYIVLGRSGTRILAVIVTRQKEKEYFLVTARDADKKERKKVYEKEKNH